MDTSLEVLRLFVLAAAEFVAHVVDSLVHFFDTVNLDVVEHDHSHLMNADYSVLLDYCRHIPDLCQVLV